jgi:hypothetical protein
MSVVEACFEGLPQLSYTSVLIEVCYDGILRLRPRTSATRRHLHEVSPAAIAAGRSVESALNDLFGPSRSMSGDKLTPRCRRSDECDMHPVRQRVVLDRMPPILVVGFPIPITMEQEKVSKAVTVLELRIQGPKKAFCVKYKPLGCIMLHRDEAHFTVRWVADRPGEDSGRIVYYDGMVNDQASDVGQFYDSLGIGRATRHAQSKETRGPIIMFYSLVRLNDTQ